MARTNEYKSTGGSFSKLTDALSSIDELLEDVKRADDTQEGAPEKKRGFRDIIAELQTNIDSCVNELKHSWNDLKLDPLYIYSTEQINTTEYVRHIKFIHPEYEHVWLTEGKGQNVAKQMIPFIDYRLTYHYQNQKITVNNLLLETKLNLPDFKTSLKAAQMDLQILKEDTKRVELVSQNGTAAHKKLTEMLQLYCDSQSIEIEVAEEIIPFVETEAERSARLKKEQQEAEKAAAEAEKAAKTEARKAEEAEREKHRHSDLERKQKQQAAQAVKDARAAAAQKRVRSAGISAKPDAPTTAAAPNAAPPRASSAPPPPPMGRASAAPPPPPPAMRKAGS
ncbi:MAG: hypothetical protein JXX29_21760 [Deltaproteobacteria bacterium]|nr:hypothetical protein [Deltaproteobacteria bacterium]MBN2674323.1 hypothetical protein [Deltaproteobacteria bacterium]